MCSFGGVGLKREPEAIVSSLFWRLVYCDLVRRFRGGGALCERGAFRFWMQSHLKVP